MIDSFETYVRTVFAKLAESTGSKWIQQSELLSNGTITIEQLQDAVSLNIIERDTPVYEWEHSYRLLNTLKHEGKIL